MNWGYPFTLPPTQVFPFLHILINTCCFLPFCNSYATRCKLTSCGLICGARIWPNKPSLETAVWTFVLCCLSMPHLPTCCVVSVVSNSLQPHGPWSPPGSSVHMFLQAWRLVWVAMCSSKGSFPPRDPPVSLASPALADRFYTTSTTWEISLSNSLIQKMRQGEVGKDFILK